MGSWRVYIIAQDLFYLFGFPRHYLLITWGPSNCGTVWLCFFFMFCHISLPAMINGLPLLCLLNSFSLKQSRVFLFTLQSCLWSTEGVFFFWKYSGKPWQTKHSSKNLSTFRRGLHIRHIYRPRSEGDNVIGSVLPSVRLCVCLSVRALLLDPFDLWPWFLAWGLTLT